MSCCDEKKLLELVKSKAENMKKMLEPYIITEEHKVFVSQYNPDDIKELVIKYLSPLYLTKSLTLARDKICDELKIEDAEIKGKIVRYLEMFCECIIGV
jgi:hypothetical protein